MLSGEADLSAIDQAAAAVEQLERDRRALHARTLGAVLDLHLAHCATGMALATPAQLALSLDCSELRSHQLLGDAQVLGLLPDAMEALEEGLLGVEQSALLVSITAPLSDSDRVTVWERFLARLRAQGCPPPARLRELLSRWVVSVDPAGAAARRKAAECDGDVALARRDDGLADLFAHGLSPSNAAACLARIRAAAVPWGGDDDRRAGKRRLDAFVDLLLGRERLPDGTEEVHCRPGCGCHLQSPVPCGAEVQVHVPLGAALGVTDELAVLVGHGPLDPEQLQDLLRNAPALRAVFVDDEGVPVAVSREVLHPRRGDLASVQQSLLNLTGSPPGPLHPRHPRDHQPSTPPGSAPPPPDDTPASTSPPGQAHPEHQAGNDRIPTGVRRLVTLRRPWCEWPGCGHRATRCDLDHDLAWPAGATCGCDLGPVCRRHHRIKQLGWVKRRTAAAVVWVNPSGRRWDSPSPFEAPAAPVRPLPSNRAVAHYSPAELEELAWAPGPDDDGPDGPSR